MTETIKNKPGVLFWVLGGLFLIWNGFGCASYLMEQTMSDAAYAEAWGDAMAAVRDKYPAWSVAAYAIAVWGGLLAAISLLLRKKWAVPLFIISLIAAIISFIWGMTNEEAKAAAGGTAWIMPLAVVTLGLIEIWWSRKKAADGTLT